MTSAFDGRLLKLTISIDGSSDVFVFDQNYYITATGTKFTNGNFGEFAVRLDNISKSTRDLIINKTSLWNLNKKVANVLLEVGRASYGTFQVLQGQCIAITPTQPPDIGLMFNSLANIGAAGIINGYTASPVATLQAIAQSIATANQLNLEWHVSPENNTVVGNYHFTGSVATQVRKLQDLGSIKAYVDPPNLVVTDYYGARGSNVVQVNAQTGMIGVPQLTASGARVKQLIQNDVLIGSSVKVQSQINPGANGTYWLNKLAFEVSSWDTPFYWIMDLVLPINPTHNPATGALT